MQSLLLFTSILAFGVDTSFQNFFEVLQLLRFSFVVLADSHVNVTIMTSRILH